MLIYLFVIDEIPQARMNLRLAQAALEENLRSRQDVSDVWWEDKRPYTARLYLYGGTHSEQVAAEAADEDSEVSFEEIGPLIFPVSMGPELSPPVPSAPPGVTMTLSVAMPDKKIDLTRVTPLGVWTSTAIERSRLVVMFAAEAAHQIAAAMSSQEEL